VWLILAGCDSTAPSVHVPEAVVEAYLIAGQRLPRVRLSWTQDVNLRYSPDELGIGGASVSVHLLDARGGDEAVFRYFEPQSDSSEAGVYFPGGQSVLGLRVLADRDYRLQVTLPDGGSLSATTHVPGAFDYLEQNAESLEYQSSERLETRVTPSAYPGRPSIFVFTIEALEPTIENLTPVFLKVFYGADPGDDLSELDLLHLEEVRISSSPPLNEANYERDQDGALTVWLPWFAVAFYGVNRVEINAIDDNIDQFMRFQHAQQGETVAPGEIPNILDTVKGGRGVFGSMTRVSAEVNVLRPGER
jgi:uncharacterized protein DUF4249